MQVIVKIDKVDKRGYHLPHPPVLYCGVDSTPVNENQFLTIKDKVMLFTVEKSTKSVNGGFVNTLTTEQKITVFGVAKTVKHRFLMKTDEEVPAGTQDEIVLSEYNQEKTESEVLDSTTGEVKIIKSTWLHRKAS